jgi:hypothetical protein
MRVEPPTRTTSSIADASKPESAIACLHGTERALDQVVDQLLELRARDAQVHVLRARGVRRDERQVDLGLRHRRELALGLLGGFLQALERHRVLAQVDALGLLELVGQPVDQALVEVVAAQVGVAVGRAHLEHAVADLEDRDVERAAAQVVDRDLLVRLLVETVGQRGRGRLVDDALDVEAAMRPASFVAWRCESLKYAGTVMTASVTFSPR